MSQKTITVGTSGSPASLDTNFANTQDNFDELYDSVLPLTVGGENTVSAGGVINKGSSASSQFIIGSNYNSIDSSITSYVLGGGRSGWGNHVGRAEKPSGVGRPDWSDDTGYTDGTARVSSIVGGYDCVSNGIASRISQSDHCFIKQNTSGHNGIFGSTYSLITAGISGILFGYCCDITGDHTHLYNHIIGGVENTIDSSSYSAILPSSKNCEISSSDYALAWGNNVKVTSASGSVTLADSGSADFVNTTVNSFRTRFSGGYVFGTGTSDFWHLASNTIATRGNIKMSTQTGVESWQLGLSASGHFTVDKLAGTESLSAIFTTTGEVGFGVEVPTASLHLPASTTSKASLRLTGGVAPTTPNEGDIYFNSATKHFLGWNGTSWLQLS